MVIHIENYIGPIVCIFVGIICVGYIIICKPFKTILIVNLMVSSTKSLSQSLIIVSNTPLEIISCGFALRGMLYGCPCNHLTLFYQFPVAKFAAYSEWHANPSEDPWILFQLLLVPILAKVVVTKIGPFTYVNSVTNYVLHPCGTSCVRDARVNIRFPYYKPKL